MSSTGRNTQKAMEEIQYVVQVVTVVTVDITPDRVQLPMTSVQ